jgi:uncharacterized membrane protein (UPF0127 family)
MRLSTSSLALLVALCLVGACREAGAGREGSASPQTTDPTAESYVMPPLPRGTVVLKDAYGGTHAVEVEIASNSEAIQRGLMWRKQLPAGKGMLFVFDDDAPHTFWMKNTLIPLDMLFIDGERRLVELAENAEPRTLTSRGGLKPCRYVLEVPGGWAQKVGVQIGGQVELHLPQGAGGQPGR